MLQDTISLPDQLHEAANYIKKLQIKLERMKEERDNLMHIKKLEAKDDKKINPSSLMAGQQRPPQIEVREIGSSLEAILITGVDFQFLFSETVRVIHEEGFDVVNANFSIINDLVVHTIHAQVYIFIFFTITNKHTYYIYVHSLCLTLYTIYYETT